MQNMGHHLGHMDTKITGAVIGGTNLIAQNIRMEDHHMKINNVFTHTNEDHDEEVNTIDEREKQLQIEGRDHDEEDYIDYENGVGMTTGDDADVMLDTMM